jgi:hypothetical protein
MASLKKKLTVYLLDLKIKATALISFIVNIKKDFDSYQSVT